MSGAQPQPSDLFFAAADRVFPAAQLVVVDAGETRLDLAVGCDADSQFDLASLTKALCTTTLAMQLHDEGRLPLDRDISCCEPQSTGTNIRALLSHSSGLPPWALLQTGTGANRNAVVAAARATPFAYAAGSRSLYSDIGFILLGAEIERCGDTMIDRLFQTRIARPLGLSVSFNPTKPARCLATEAGLVGVVHDENARSMGGIAPHAGLFGSAREVSTLVRNLVGSWHDSPGLVRAETVRLFWSPSAVAGSTWCLGWDRPSPVGQFSAAGALWPRDGVGHLGFTGCSLWIDPARKRWVVLLTNRVCPTRENNRIREFRPQLHDAIVAALDGAAGL